MGIEDLQYGDTYELRNGDSCVYIRTALEEPDDEAVLIFQELNLVNVFTGEEHNINDYNDDLTHMSDKQLDIVG